MKLKAICSSVTIFPSLNLAGLGVVVHDSNGAVNGALSIPITLGSSVAELEALACLRAMQFASEIGLTQVVFEGVGQVHLLWERVGWYLSSCFCFSVFLFQFS